jgi:aldose 1-epimerase
MTESATQSQPHLASHTLSSDTLRLELSPAIGAGILGFSVLRPSGEWLPLMRPTLREYVQKASSGRFASYILMPYSNRIRDAKFVFQGQEYQTRINALPEGTARHGDVFSRPWTTILHDQKEARYNLDSRDFEDFNFPFPLLCTTGYKLEGSTLVQELKMENIGPLAAPVGFGIHPYFNRFLPGAHEGLLQFGATGVYHTPADMMPQGAAQPLGPEMDFSVARALGKQSLDTVFAGWNGSVTLSWPDLKLSVEITADPIFSHLVVYTHYDGSLALEPVTNATDGFNLFAKGIEGTNVRILEPGQTLEGKIRIRVIQE